MTSRKKNAVVVIPEGGFAPSPLQQYMEKHSLSQEAFAKKIGVSQGLVWQWVDGRTRITAERAIEIEEKTEGEITRGALRPDLYASARAA